MRLVGSPGRALVRVGRLWAARLQRNIFVTIRVSRREIERLDAGAYSAGITVSEYIRRALFNDQAN